VIIDIHGHYTTAPAALEAWRKRQIAGIKDPAAMPKAADLAISDDELRDRSDQPLIRCATGSDLTVFSPRASFMAHHIGDFRVSSTWGAICNVCAIASPPCSRTTSSARPCCPVAGVDPASCIPELKKCVEEYGFVAINLNPDPSGGHWTSPPLTDRHWYPIYEQMVDYDIPAMIHVSTSCNACFHTTGAHYINADTTAVMQLIQGDFSRIFPTLSVIHHGAARPLPLGL